jgi:type I restriction enzyme S subunit
MTPSKTNASYWDGDVNWFSSRDIKSDELTESGLKITSAGLSATRLQLYPPGSLFMVARSGILKHTFPVSINRVEGAANQDLKVLMPFVSGLENYLQIMFRGMNDFIITSLVKTGMTVQSLVYEEFEKQPFPLPPLAEQKRIVAKVDELMALCDRLEAQQQEREEQAGALARASLARFAEAPTPANLNLLFHKSYNITPTNLRKSILTVAVQGKLIRFESRHTGKTIGDHIEFLNGYAFKSEWFKPSGVRLCRNANVSHGVIDWHESVFVGDDIAKEFERFVLREGDIVLSLDRPLITTGLKVARVRKSDLPCLLLQRVAKPVPKHDQLDLSFFLLWLNSSEFVDTIDPGRSNGVPHISTRQVQSLPFILPPLAEQRRIVAKVAQLMDLVDQLETQLAASRATAKNLLDALVAELTHTS